MPRLIPSYLKSRLLKFPRMNTSPEELTCISLEQVLPPLRLPQVQVIQRFVNHHLQVLSAPASQLLLKGTSHTSMYHVGHPATLEQTLTASVQDQDLSSHFQGVHRHSAVTLQQHRMQIIPSEHMYVMASRHLEPLWSGLLGSSWVSLTHQLATPWLMQRMMMTFVLNNLLLARQNRVCQACR